MTIGTALYPNLLTISVTVLDASEVPASVDYFEGMVTGSSYLDEYGTTISIPSNTGLNQNLNWLPVQAHPHQSFTVHTNLHSSLL